MVDLKSSNIEVFFRECQGRKVYAFGAADSLKKRRRWRTPDYDLSKIICGFVDNDGTKWGMQYELEGVFFNIISPQTLRGAISKEDIVLVTSGNYAEIVAQMDGYEELDGTECYILPFIDDFFDSAVDFKEYIEAQGQEFYIPPVIHYCWFGDRPIPDKYLEYIESWKKYCPGYRLVKWDEHNYDVRKHPYLRRAYDNRKWAFVSDYARLDILYEHGGIYLDTDVELIKSLDELRRFHAFVGYESTQMIDTGLGIGAEKGHEIIKCLRDTYDTVDAGNSSGWTPCTVYQTGDLRKLGLRCDNSFQVLQDGRMAVLPTEFLCGIRLCTRERQVTEHTCALHHYSGDWGGKAKRTVEETVAYSRPLLKRARTYLEACPSAGK